MAGINDGLNGIICVNKPAGFTSFDVIAKMRGILRLKRLGHAGTLDPMATGVLPVFAGKATRACDILPDHDKIYEAGFRLGITSDTQDITGTVTESGSFDGIDRDRIEAALKDFRGDIMQIPPMYSAVTVNGTRLYDLARRGVEVERQPRPIKIYELALTDYNAENGCGGLRISCSKGTYIRTLISDIGERLSCGAVMSSLVRTAACGFTLDGCVTLDELQKNADEGCSAEKYVYPIEKVFTHLNEIRLNEAQEKMYRCGVKLDKGRLSFKLSEQNSYRVSGADGEFIGTAYFDGDDLHVGKNF